MSDKGDVVQKYLREYINNHYPRYTRIAIEKQLNEAGYSDDEIYEAFLSLAIGDIEDHNGGWGTFWLCVIGLPAIFLFFVSIYPQATIIYFLVAIVFFLVTPTAIKDRSPGAAAGISRAFKVLFILCIVLPLLAFLILFGICIVGGGFY